MLAALFIQHFDVELRLKELVRDQIMLYFRKHLALSPQVKYDVAVTLVTTCFETFLQYWQRNLRDCSASNASL